jgi:hypothetical protein
MSEQEEMARLKAIILEMIQSGELHPTVKGELIQTLNEFVVSRGFDPPA